MATRTPNRQARQGGGATNGPRRGATPAPAPHPAPRGAGTVEVAPHPTARQARVLRALLEPHAHIKTAFPFDTLHPVLVYTAEGWYRRLRVTNATVATLRACGWIRLRRMALVEPGGGQYRWGITPAGRAAARRH